MKYKLTVRMLTLEYNFVYQQLPLFFFEALPVRQCDGNIRVKIKTLLSRKNKVAMSWYNDNGIRMDNQCGFQKYHGITKMICMHTYSGSFIIRLG